MSEDISFSDLKHISFGDDPAVLPFLEPARRLAADMIRADPSWRSPSAHGVASAAIARLGVADILAEPDFKDKALPLLYEIAQLFGHTNPAAGWAGLAQVPAHFLGLPDRSAHIAVPDGEGRWVAWLPSDDTNARDKLYWLDPDRRQLLSRVASTPCGLTIEQQHGLLGMPGTGALILLDSPALQQRVSHPLEPDAWNLYRSAQLALLSGLISGACRRMRQEAYAYAKLRRSAGKPIAQLQAVALRLANLALAEQTLSLYSAAAANAPHRCDPVTAISSLNVSYFKASAFQVAREAVQVAAAHGYVEGLPLKRLYEQVHTLASVLSSYAERSASTGE